MLLTWFCGVSVALLGVVILASVRQLSGFVVRRKPLANRAALRPITANVLGAAGLDEHYTHATSVSKAPTEPKDFSDAASKLQRRWHQLTVSDLGVTVWSGYIIVGLIFIVNILMQFLDLGMYERLDTVVVSYATDLLWSIGLAITLGTAVWLTGRFNVPNRLQATLLIAMLCLFIGLGLGLGGLATEGRQYLGFAAGVASTLLLVAIGLYVPRMAADIVHTIGKDAFMWIRALYGVMIVQSLLHHLWFVLSSTGTGAWSVASDVFAVADTIDVALYITVGVMYWKIMSHIRVFVIHELVRAYRLTKETEPPRNAAPLLSGGANKVGSKIPEYTPPYV